MFYKFLILHQIVIVPAKQEASEMIYSLIKNKWELLQPYIKVRKFYARINYIQTQCKMFADSCKNKFDILKEIFKIYKNDKIL